MANNERIVDLVVRAKDQYSKVLANLKQQQLDLAEAGRKAQLQASIAQKTAMAGTRKELVDTQGEIKKLAADYRNLTATQGASRAEIAQLVIAKAKLQAKAGELKAALTATQQATHRLRVSQQSSFIEFARNTSALQSEAIAANGAAVALKKVEMNTNAAAAAQARMANQPLARPGVSGSGGFFGGKSDAIRGNEKLEILGLSATKSVNLLYQANDIVSGLAMGQAPLQVLAQQAGQVIQIWPEMLVTIAKSARVFSGIGIVLTLFGSAIAESVGRTKALEEFTRRLSTMAEGARYSAEQLSKITRNFEELRPLLESGFSQESLKGFYDLAKTLGNANGKSVAENVDALAKAFGGGVEGVRNLDRELNFLTADQLRQIRAMEQQGDTAGALKVAQEALGATYQQFADKATGPWSRSWKMLGETWRDLMKWMSNTLPIQLTIKAFNALGRVTEFQVKVWKELLGLLNEKPVASGVADHANSLRSEVERIQNWVDNSGSLPPGWTQEMFDNLKSELADTESLLAELNEQKSKSVALGEVDVQTTEEGKKLIDDQLAALQEEARLAQMTERARFQELEVLKAKNKAMEEGIALGKMELDRLREQAGTAFDMQNSGVSGNLIDKITGVESGGNASAKNPNSTATGLGQFIESTWLRMFKEYFPDRAAGMTEAAMLELRKDGELSRKMTELYILENKKNLEQFGIAVNDASIYLSHFLGPGGAVKVLGANPSTPVSSLLGDGQINANQSILQGKTAGEVVAWAQRKMKLSDEEVAATGRLIEMDQERVEKATEYNTEYAKRIADQQFELEMATKSAREAAISKAIRDEELVAQKAGLTLTTERRAEVEKIAAATFDNANAETRVNELMTQRSMLMESLTLAQEAGDQGGVSRIITEIGETEEELNKAIDAAILFYQAMGGEAADAAILKLQNMKNAVGNVVRDMATQYLPTAEQLNEQIVDLGGNAFSAFAESIAKGENAWSAFKNALVQGLAEVVISIGKAIVQQALFNALTGGGANPGGGIGGTIAGLITGLFHTGGVVGSAAGGSGSRMVNPSVFSGAQRYHTGGVPALGPNEVPIIAMKDEEVITRDDPRHVMNGGASPGGVNVKSVNVFNPVDVMEAALESEIGEKVLINWMTRRARTINGALAV